MSQRSVKFQGSQSMLQQPSQDVVLQQISQKLPYLTTRSEASIENLVDLVKKDPLDSSTHQLLEAALFQRLCQQDIMIKQLQTCDELRQQNETLTANIDALSRQAAQLHLSELCNDLDHLGDGDFRPTIAESDATVLAQQLTTIQETARGYLNPAKEAAESPEDDVVNAFNRATIRLRERDQQILEANRMIQSMAQPTAQQLFIELANNELLEQQAPTDSKQFVSSKFATSLNVKKSIAELLRETMALLNKTAGRESIQFEQQLQPVQLYIKQQLSDEQISVLQELQRIAQLALAVRYATQACLDVKQDQPEPRMIQRAEVQNQHTLDRSFGQIVRALFGMSLWPEQQFLKKGFGNLQSNELIKLLNQTETGLPSGFYDENLARELNECILSKLEVHEQFERLAIALQEYQYKQRIIPSACAELGKLSVELEDTNKNLNKQIVEKEQLALDLKQIIKQEGEKRADLLQQNQSRDLLLQQVQQQLANSKNELKRLEVDNNRIPGLEKNIEEIIKNNESLKFSNSQNEQKATNAEQKCEQLQVINQKIVEDTKEYETKIRKLQINLQQSEDELAEIQKLRNEAMLKNRELVSLCHSMEQRINEQEQEISKQAKTVQNDMPTLQDNQQRQKQIINQLQAELDQLQTEKRSVTSRLADCELLHSKNSNQLEQTLKQLTELSEKHASLQTEYNMNVRELDAVSKMFVAEQQKAQLFGAQIDEMAERNMDLERDTTALKGRTELLEKNQRESEQLLFEAQTYIKQQSEQFSNTKQLLEQTHNKLMESQQTATRNDTENNVLKHTLQQANERQQQMKQQYDNEVDAKQRLISDLTTQMSQLTVTMQGNDFRLNTLVKSQYTNDMQKQLEQQQSMFEQKMQKTEYEAQVLSQELAKTRQDMLIQQRECKQLTAQNELMRDQLKQLTEVQEKLSEKARKLLTTTSILKQKLLDFSHIFERLVGYTDGKLVYEAIRDSTDLSVNTITQSAKELHTTDLLKISPPNEQLVRKICDLVKDGVKATEIMKFNETRDSQLRQLTAKVQQYSTQESTTLGQIKQYEIQITALTEKVHQMTKTIDILTQVDYSDSKKPQLKAKQDVLENSDVGQTFQLTRGLNNMDEKLNDETQKIYTEANFKQSASKLIELSNQKMQATKKQKKNSVIEYIPLTMEEEMTINKLMEQQIKPVGIMIKK